MNNSHLDEILAMLDPGDPPKHGYRAILKWEVRYELYARAIELAGAPEPSAGGRVMSRLEEVEAELTAILRKTKRPQLAAASLARTLANEVDELTADRDSECRWACQYKAERDELKRRLDAVVGECCGTRGMHARAVAIAEGRDND